MKEQFQCIRFVTVQLKPVSIIKISLEQGVFEIYT